jgi:hypothetical protein
VSRAVLLRDHDAGTSASAGSETCTRANRSALAVDARRKRSGEGEQALCNKAAANPRPTPESAGRTEVQLEAVTQAVVPRQNTSAHAEPHLGATRRCRAGDAAVRGLALQTVAGGSCQRPANPQRSTPKWT